MTRRVGRSLRRAVAERARGLCEYCRSPETLDGKFFGCSAHAVDHVVPRSRSGATRLENLALCCQGCNGRKWNRTHVVDESSGEVVPLFDPRQQEWSHHFMWSQDFLSIVGTTAVGRVTVAALDLNREGLVALRRALRRLGKHPL